MVEYRLRPEHAEQVRTIKAASQIKLEAVLKALSGELTAQLQPIFSFYGINPSVKGYIEEKPDGDMSFILPEALSASMF